MILGARHPSMVLSRHCTCDKVGLLGRLKKLGFTVSLACPQSFQTNSLCFSLAFPCAPGGILLNSFKCEWMTKIAGVVQHVMAILNACSNSSFCLHHQVTDFLCIPESRVWSKGLISGILLLPTSQQAAHPVL